MQASQIITGDETGLIKVFALYHDYLNAPLVSKQRSFPNQKVAITALEHDPCNANIFYAGYENGVIIKYRIPEWTPCKKELLKRRLEAKGHSYSKKFDVNLSLVTEATTILESKDKIWSLCCSEDTLFAAIEGSVLRFDKNLTDKKIFEVKEMAALKRVESVLEPETGRVNFMIASLTKLPFGARIDPSNNKIVVWKGKNFPPDNLRIEPKITSTFTVANTQGTFVAAGVEKGRVAFYNRGERRSERKATELKAFKPRDHLNGCYAISAMALNDKYLAIGDVEGTCSVIDPFKDVRLGNLPRVSGGQVAMKWLDDDHLVSTGLDRTMKVYRMVDNKVKLEHEIFLQQRCRVVSTAMNQMWNYIEEEEGDITLEVQIDDEISIEVSESSEDSFLIDGDFTPATKERRS